MIQSRVTRLSLKARLLIGVFTIAALGGAMARPAIAQTPPAVVRKLTDGLVAVLRDPEVARRYRELGGRPGGMPQAQFTQLVDNDRKSWGALITSRQLQLD